jgi:hypothetical protein
MVTVEISEAADAESELMPLDFILAIMRDKYAPESIRFEAAKAALPYCHAKLASIKDSGTGEFLSHEEALAELAADVPDIPSHEDWLKAALADGDPMRR